MGEKLRIAGQFNDLLADGGWPSRRSPVLSGVDQQEVGEAGARAQNNRTGGCRPSDHRHARSRRRSAGSAFRVSFSLTSTPMIFFQGAKRGRLERGRHCGKCRCNTVSIEFYEVVGQDRCSYQAIIAVKKRRYSAAATHQHKEAEGRSLKPNPAAVPVQARQTTSRDRRCRPLDLIAPRVFSVSSSKTDAALQQQRNGCRRHAAIAMRGCRRRRSRCCLGRCEF